MDKNNDLQFAVLSTFGIGFLIVVLIVLISLADWSGQPDLSCEAAGIRMSPKLDRVGAVKSVTGVR